MPPLLRRRPLLRAAAIGSGAYYAGRKRQQSARARDASAPSAPASRPGGRGDGLRQQ
jgi:hypothetical protein